MATVIKLENSMDDPFADTPIHITHIPQQQHQQQPPKQLPISSFQMPSTHDINTMPDLTWCMIRSRYQRDSNLTSDNRSKLSRAVIKFVFMRMFESHGTFDIRLSSQQLAHLTSIIVELFPTESPETFFVRSSKGKNASGKLYNSYINTRQDVMESGLIGAKRRRMRESSDDREDEEEQEVLSEPSRALDLCQSVDFGDIRGLTAAWDECYDERCALLSRIGAHDYFGMFPYLGDGSGYKWVRKKYKKNLKP
jgi:hypothetical protein